MRRIGRAGWILGLAVIVHALFTTHVGAQATGVGSSVDQLEWEQTSVAEPVQRLFATASGVVFAATDGRALRSTDGGTSWQTVALPPGEQGGFAPGRPALVAVDPRAAAVVYASGSDGLYRSTDAGSTWQLSTALEPSTRIVSVSPADSKLVYLGITVSGRPDIPLRILRSRDAGGTWQEILRTAPASLCGWVFYVLQAHPTDVQRVFNSFACAAGRVFGADADQSRDQGTSWSALFHLMTNGVSAGYPSRLVGGQGLAPTRFYLAVNRDFRLGGSTLFRTDDDGANWREVLAFSGGGTFAEFGPDAPNTRIHGLAYDPSAPDLVYAGLAIDTQQGGQRVGQAGRIQASSDGGATWQQVGQDIGLVNDLVLGLAADRLYAATDTGIWRTRRVLPPAPPVQLPPR